MFFISCIKQKKQKEKGGKEAKAPHILNLDIRWKWVTSFTTLREKSLITNNGPPLPIKSLRYTYRPSLVANKGSITNEQNAPITNKTRISLTK
jgi:hypothetical protein